MSVTTDVNSHSDSAEWASIPAKRRKFYRKRNDDDEQTAIFPDVSTTAQTPDVPQLMLVPAPEDAAYTDNLNVNPAEEEAYSEAPASLTDLLRRRNKLGHRRRAAGIEFSASSSNPGGSTQDAVEATMDNDGGALKDDGRALVDRRFAPQTGLVADVDKHMYV